MCLHRIHILDECVILLLATSFSGFRSALSTVIEIKEETIFPYRCYHFNDRNDESILRLFARTVNSKTSLESSRGVRAGIAWAKREMRMNVIIYLIFVGFVAPSLSVLQVNQYSRPCSKPLTLLPFFLLSLSFYFTRAFHLSLYRTIRLPAHSIPASSSFLVVPRTPRGPLVYFESAPTLFPL